jgi:hypothetical protein
VGIARGSSCAPVFDISRRKMSLCEALRGRAAMANHGELAGEEGEGGEGAKLGGRHGECRRGGSALAAATCSAARCA